MAKNLIFPNTVIPKTAVLEMTYNCNHRCLFCSVPWYSPQQAYRALPELPIEDWIGCVDKLAGWGIRNIAFSGGEPLLKAGLEKLMMHVKSKHVPEAVFNSAGEHTGFKEACMDISLISNGELIDDYWVGLFREHKVNVIISLPGICTFKELTGGGSYKKAVAAISKCSESGLDVVVSICVTKLNLPELFETISLGFLNGAKQLLLNRFLPGGRGVTRGDLCLNREEIIAMLDIAEEACSAAKSFGSVGTELPKCLITKEYKMLKIGTMCSGGVEFFAVDPSGYVRPCNHSPVRLGDFRDVREAIATDYWQKFKQKDFLPKECLGCGLSLHCDGGCREAAHIVNKSLNSPDVVFSGVYA